MEAIAPEAVETFRPLLPVGYRAGVRAYQTSTAELTAHDMTTHYTDGLDWFQTEFVPRLKQRLTELSGGIWDFSEYRAIAAGSDVDLMTHLVEAVAMSEPVWLYPGDWYGFLSGATQRDRIEWTTAPAKTRDGLACLCVPSVRNGHLTAEMADFLNAAPACLLNLNLYPTLTPAERQAIAGQLAPLLPKSVLSISFSRGFGLTASQLGVALVHPDHPYGRRFDQQWNWLTYFYNALAARAFLAIDLDETQRVDQHRREWVHAWLADHNLPVVSSGSYYVKSFRTETPLPPEWQPLVRGEVVRLCFKPPQVGP